ncbi:ester cyclase [Roseibium sp. RKSG952]|uniref:ester cyclase n=1 Tax=Roseibium sp. RKSG952 TaxID=2529384 RepID=UPI0012BCAFF0|nr:ester cyclase [Roseibium sp. RKSG952]MTH95798.1 hypothetical protein [Roseibium sp. RKSG952]
MSDDDLKLLSRQILEHFCNGNADGLDGMANSGLRVHFAPGVVSAMPAPKNNRWRDILSAYGEDFIARDDDRERHFNSAGAENTMDLAELRSLLTCYQENFSNSRVEIIGQISETNSVSTWWAMTAEHTGSLIRDAGAGKTIHWKGASLDRFSGGKLSESRVVWNKYSFLKGLKIV